MIRNVTPLYEQLRSANKYTRRDIAAALIKSMQLKGSEGYEDYWKLCQEVIAKEQPSGVDGADKEPSSGWEFSPANSALLVAREPRRTRAFLQAITAAPQAETAIDAGCGSSALLAVGTAVAHPRAEIVAYEINEHAANCARAVVDLMGLSDRIQVVEGDVLDTTIPEVDLAVTETFAMGLLTERGHEITAKLAQTAKEILPAYATLYTCDERPGVDTFWQRSAVVDFGVQNDDVRGSLRAKGRGLRPVHAFAAFYNTRHEPILTETGTALTNAVHLGNVVVPRPDMHIEFGYALGSELHEKPAMLKVVE